MNLPEQLFRYRSGSTDFLRQELQAALRNEVWCNSLNALNDPFEAHPVREKQTRKVVADWIRKFREIHGYVSVTGQPFHEMAEILGVSKSEVRKKFGTPLQAADMEIKSFDELCRRTRANGISCSFSEVGTSASMWALYSQDHRGYSQIWAKRSSDQIDHKRNANGLGYVQKVNYQSKRPTLSVTELANMIACASFERDDELLNHKAAEQSSAKFGAVKSDEWSREKEWRLVSFDNIGSGYLHMGDYTFGGVVLGLECDPAVEKEIRSTIADQKPIYRSRKSSVSFEIEVVS